MKVSKDAPAEGEVIEASVAAKDLDGDKLKWQWTLIDEASYYGEAGLGLAMPEGWDESIVEGQGTNKVKVKLPGGGNYRLYAYCFDGKGNAAYANWPLVGKGPKPKKELRPAPVPYPVYRDGAQGVWYVSGYMGNTGAMKVDDSCAENPHSGATCMKVSYSDNGNWAGIFWQSPANDWGDKPGGANLSKAATLVFWARGEKGGEKVSFFMGGIKNKAFSDTANRHQEQGVLRHGEPQARERHAQEGVDALPHSARRRRPFPDQDGLRLQLRRPRQALRLLPRRHRVRRRLSCASA